MKNLSFFLALTLWTLENDGYPNIMAMTVESGNENTQQPHSDDRMRILLFPAFCSISSAGSGTVSDSKQLKLCIVLPAIKALNTSRIMFVFILGDRDDNLTLCDCKLTIKKESALITNVYHICRSQTTSEILKQYNSLLAESNLTLLCTYKAENHSVIKKQLAVYCICELPNMTCYGHIPKLLCKNKTCAGNIGDTEDFKNPMKKVMMQLLNGCHREKFFKQLDVEKNVKGLSELNFRRNTTIYRNGLVDRLKRAVIKDEKRQIRDDTKRKTHSAKLELENGSASSKSSPTDKRVSHSDKGAHSKFEHPPTKEQAEKMDILQKMRDESHVENSVQPQQQKESEIESHNKNEISPPPAAARNYESFLNETENEYQQFLRQQTIRWQLRLHGQYAYLCLTFLICLMLLCLWCMRGFHSRNTNKKPVTFHDDSHLLTVKEVLYRRARYLPMFNQREPEWEEVFLHDCGNNP